MPSATARQFQRRTKFRFYAVLFACSIVTLLWIFGDRLPPLAQDLFFPGAFVTVLINGSLHDRIIPGYFALVALFNCLFYSALVLLGIWLVEKFRKAS
jgi:hypothetical protein